MLTIQAVHVLFDPGDTLLVETPMYPGVLPESIVTRVSVVPVGMDSEGISAHELDDTLRHWHTDERTKHLRFPKAVYTVPTGSNPAGTTASEQRKRDMLAVVRRHKVLLLEDDPYYFLSFEGLGSDPVTRPRPQSYFALEHEDAEMHGYGYVLRFESFSKILSAGMRAGFAVGPPVIVDALQSATATTNLHTSGPPQALIAALLQHWSRPGFLRHVDSVAMLYKQRRDAFEARAQATLGQRSFQPLATWITPVAGMFFWLKLHLPPTPEAPEGDSGRLISEKAIAYNVLVMPGGSFFPDGRPTPYLRASYSTVSEDEMGEALRRLRQVIEAAWREAGYAEIPPMQA